MTPRSLLRMLRQRWLWLLLGPAVAAALVLFATRNRPDEYASVSILNTGLVSGYTIESAGDDRVDYLTIANAFDNLVNLVQARTTVEETALRLLARQLVVDPGRLRVFDAARAPAVLRTVDGAGSEARILERLRAAKHRPESAVYALLFQGETPFAVDEIQAGLSVSRVAASDLLRMRYVSIDPLLCQWTLEVLLDVVTSRHQAMKTQETGSVVAYFEREANRAREELRNRVDALRGFGVDNRVINYDEQTKAIAIQKEAIEAQLQEERQRQAAAEAVVDELEERMVRQQALAVQSDTVLTLRNRLAEVATALTLAEGAGTPRPDLRREADRLEAALTQQVAQLYDLSTTREGLNRENIAVTWLEKLLEATDARAQVALLDQRLADYVGYYDEFSPLGATLAMLEREVDTAERTYLELLNSLNMARMREQNIQLASRLEVVDAPLFPEEAEASPRPLLTLGAMAGCFGLLVTLFVLVELFHPTLRSLERARMITGLAVASAYPPLAPPRGRLGRALRRMRWRGLVRKADPLEPPADAGASAGGLHDTLRVLDLHLMRAVKLRLLGLPAHGARATAEGDGLARPLRLAVVGAMPDDDVALVATRLAMLLRDEYDRVRHVAFAPPDAVAGTDAPPLGPGFDTDVDRETVASLPDLGSEPVVAVAAPAAKKRPRSKETGRFLKADALPQVEIVELPAMVEQTAPLQVVRDADLALVVLRADRVWTDADQHALGALKEAHPRPLVLVLTGVQPDFLNGLTAQGLPIPPVLRPVFG